jgi:hypothetical protein
MSVETRFVVFSRWRLQAAKGELMTAVRLYAIAAMFGLAADVELAAQKNKVSCGADVAVTVTISGSSTAPGGYALVSDGGGAYRNTSKGNDKLTAIMQVDNCTHDFTMNLNFSKRSMFSLLEDASGNQFVRRGNFFNFDRVHSVPITSDPGFMSSAYCANGVQLNPDGTFPKTSSQDNYGGCHLDETGVAFVRRAGGVSLDPDERLSFNVSPIDRPGLCPDLTNQACGASFVRVYRPDANTWFIRSDPPSSASYRVWSGGGYVEMGYQLVPFEILVTRP